MRVVICTPLAPDDARRAEIAKWVHAEWLEKHHPGVPIFEGIAVGAGNARNDAARQAGDWDVALFNDSDTIAHPEAVEAAIARAADSMQLVVAADSHMYCGEKSSNRILAGGLLLPRPYKVDHPSLARAVYAQPCSGVFAMSRRLWDATGGYIAMMGADGCEDESFMELSRIFGEGISFIPEEMTFHLWHEPGPDRYRRPPPNYQRNRKIWQTLAVMARRGSAQTQARNYLATLGHKVP